MTAIEDGTSCTKSRSLQPIFWPLTYFVLKVCSGRIFCTVQSRIHVWVHPLKMMCYIPKLGHCNLYFDPLPTSKKCLSSICVSCTVSPWLTIFICGYIRATGVEGFPQSSYPFGCLVNLHSWQRIFNITVNFLKLQTHHTFLAWILLFYAVLNLVLLSPDIPCLYKQCRSRSVGFWRNHWSGSELFAIKYMNLYQQTGSDWLKIGK